jgi:hypothetical protein
VDTIKPKDMNAAPEIYLTGPEFGLEGIYLLQFSELSNRAFTKYVTVSSLKVK